jgi:NADH-quinone oxidoreductase subunit N
MTLHTLFIMRHEVLLTLLILFELMADVADSKRKYRIINFTVFFFFIITVAGFIPFDQATLFGSMYIGDNVRVLLKNVLNISTLIVLLQSVSWLNKAENESKIGPFYLLLFSTLMGMQFMISSGNFLMLYLGLELATLPLALLAAFDKGLKRSAEAGIKLVLSSAVSSAVMLFGISIMYGVYGSLDYSVLHLSAEVGPLSIMALIFFLSGLGFKISLVPFHLWTADVYEGSPLSVTSYFSVVSKGAAVFTLMLVLYRVLGHQVESWSRVLYVLSITTMIVGNLFALRQKNLKRFMAFSSITQAGFMMLAFMNNGTLGMTSLIYFMFIYGFSNLAVFGVLIVVYNATGKETMDDFNGFYSSNPRLSLVLLLALFSLAGIPPVAGFFGKFFLFTAAASSGMYILVLIAVLNATLSLYYYLLVVKAMFINKSDAPIARITSPWSDKLALAICFAGILAVGFLSSIYDYIQSQV